MEGYGQAVRSIRGLVNAKIERLQRDYVGGSATVRGTLARLRRLDTPGGGSWMMVGDELLLGLPDFGRYERPALLSIKCALKLYALHQQSKSEGVAVTVTDSATRSGSFGYACSCISSGPAGQGAEGVRRRMGSIEAAPDLAGAETYLRALVRLIRGATEHGGAPVRLNYGDLASDLFLIQMPGSRETVFMRWARDYYSYNPVSDTTSPDNGQR